MREASIVALPFLIRAMCNAMHVHVRSVQSTRRTNGLGGGLEQDPQVARNVTGTLAALQVRLARPLFCLVLLQTFKTLYSAKTLISMYPLLSKSGHSRLLSSSIFLRF